MQRIASVAACNLNPLSFKRLGDEEWNARNAKVTDT
jgi:hypothetical protein